MIIADTNLVSELMKPQPAPAVLMWLSTPGRGPLVTTAITMAEIEYGLSRLPDGARRTNLLQRFRILAGGASGMPVLALDEPSGLEAGRLRALRVAAGFSPTAADMMIAGIVRVAGATLATRNIKDFNGLPIAVLDPWQP